jgi:hypothetical protein
MTELLTAPLFLPILLGTLAVATPLAASVMGASLHNARLRMAIGASGPILLALWGLQILVFETLGFASVWSALLLLVVAVSLGVIAGAWISGGSSANRKDHLS